MVAFSIEAAYLYVCEVIAVKLIIPNKAVTYIKAADSSVIGKS